MNHCLQRCAFLLWLGLIPVTGFCAIDTYEFTRESDRERFRALTSDLRCPKCQNQNIADSNSEIAKDLRTEIHRMVEAGQSDSDIVDFMISRYGDFVLYKPRLNSSTYVLWFAPLGLLLTGGLTVFWLSRRSRRRRQTDADPAAELAPQEQQRLRDILNHHDD